MLIAPLAFALYNVIAKPLLERHDPIAVSAAASLIGTVGLLPLLSGHPAATVRSLGAEEWGLILYLGLACTLAAYIGWTLALRQLDPSRAVAYLYCVPVLGVVTGRSRWTSRSPAGWCWAPRWLSRASPSPSSGRCGGRARSRSIHCRTMGKGYAEGPAAEEAEAARERGDHLAAARHRPSAPGRVGLDARTTPRSTSWAGPTRSTPDELFASGTAWGIKVVNAVE